MKRSTIPIQRIAGPDPFFGLVQLSVIRALLGEITPEIRAVLVELRGHQVTVRVIHEGVASADLIEAMDEAQTEILADVPASEPDALSVKVLLVRSDEPAKIQAAGRPVFARRGTYFER